MISKKKPQSLSLMIDTKSDTKNDTESLVDIVDFYSSISKQLISKTIDCTRYVPKIDEKW